MKFLHLTIALPDHVDVMLGCLDSAPGFLLKGVKHIYTAGEPHSIDSPVSITTEIVNDLQNPSTPKSLEGLGVRMLISQLGQVESEAHDVSHFRGELLQVFAGRTHPDNRFKLFAHMLDYARTGIRCRGRQNPSFGGASVSGKPQRIAVRWGEY
jgi:hypothetical protein